MSLKDGKVAVVFWIYAADKEAVVSSLDEHGVNKIMTDHKVDDSGRFVAKDQVSGILVTGSEELVASRAKSLLLRDSLLVNVNNHDNLVHEVDQMFGVKSAALRM